MLLVPPSSTNNAAGAGTRRGTPLGSSSTLHAAQCSWLLLSDSSGLVAAFSSSSSTSPSCSPSSARSPARRSAAPSPASTAPPATTSPVWWWRCNAAARRAAAQTDGGGNFDVAVPEAPASRCAARVLGATQRLCAPQRLAVARVVAGREPGSYALGSRLAVFTRCGALATTMAAGDGDQGPTPTPAAPRLSSPPARAAPRFGRSSPPYGLGIPLIYVFPFIPIIGIP